MQVFVHTRCAQLEWRRKILLSDIWFSKLGNTNYFRKKVKKTDWAIVFVVTLVHQKIYLAELADTLLEKNLISKPESCYS